MFGTPSWISYVTEVIRIGMGVSFTVRMKKKGKEDVQCDKVFGKR